MSTTTLRAVITGPSPPVTQHGSIQTADDFVFGFMSNDCKRPIL